MDLTIQFRGFQSFWDFKNINDQTRPLRNTNLKQVIDYEECTHIMKDYNVISEMIHSGWGPKARKLSLYYLFYGLFFLSVCGPSTCSFAVWGSRERYLSLLSTQNTKAMNNNLSLNTNSPMSLCARNVERITVATIIIIK